MDLVTRAGIEWGAAGRSYDGSGPSGDLWAVLPTAYGTLIALADGLGRGPEAASAARAALALVRRERAILLAALFQRCHEALRGTRGVVMTLAAVHSTHATLTWMGVGNVEAVLLRAQPGRGPARESLLLRSGVLGHRLPPLTPSVVGIAPGDTLILATDGIGWLPGQAPAGSEPPAAMARRLLDQHARHGDDAAVVVARCREGAR